MFYHRFTGVLLGYSDGKAKSSETVGDDLLQSFYTGDPLEMARRAVPKYECLEDFLSKVNINVFFIITV